MQQQGVVWNVYGESEIEKQIHNEIIRKVFERMNEPHVITDSCIT